MTSKVRIEEAGRFDIEAVLGNIERGTNDLIGGGLKFGFNAAVGTTPEGVHSLGGDINFPVAAETVRIKAGGNAADTAAGDGARSVMVTGIDSNLNRLEELIVTAGASASAATTALFWRVYDAHLVDVGTYGEANTGDIIIENTTSTQALISISALDGMPATSLICTPQKVSLVITALSLEVEALMVVEFKLCIRENFTNVAAPFDPRLSRLSPMKTPAGIWPVPFDAPLVVPPLSDVWLEALVPATTAEAGSLMSYYTVPAL